MSKKITPSIAGILADKIIEQAKKVNKSKLQEAIGTLQEAINTDPDVQKALKLVAEIDKLNKKIIAKYKKQLNSSYHNSSVVTMGGKKELTKWVQDYKLAGHTKPMSRDAIKNDLILAGWANGDTDPDTLVAVYVKKYTK